MKNKNSIPTDEEFDRASRLMKESSRNLDAVRDHTLQNFVGRCPLHDVFILNQRDVDFRAYVFFEKNDDIEACKRSGVQDEIIKYVYSELKCSGRSKNDEIKVSFEFDSNENVSKNFEGDYYLRLR